MDISLDIIGDVHGELPALEALLGRLGYDGNWSHPEGRLPVFLGDLVDRGAHGLEVARRVRDLVRARRAFCLMGNHEYNLAAWHLGVPGYGEPKRSNRRTIEAARADGDAWRPIFAWFSQLPVGLVFPELRVIHACWHKASLSQVDSVLVREPAAPGPEADAYAWVEAHVAIRSPFGPEGLLPGLPGDTADKSDDIPHEDLMKGFEVQAAEPFIDVDGHRRTRKRATWWMDGRAAVLDDRPQVFGHYWNCPPFDGRMVPPHPPGTRELRRWAVETEPLCPAEGSVDMQGDLACIDFHGITDASSARACIGALRWPERQIVWATGDKTAPDRLT